jgi:hypothetical protein
MSFKITVKNNNEDDFNNLEAIIHKYQISAVDTVKKVNEIITEKKKRGNEIKEQIKIFDGNKEFNREIKILKDIDHQTDTIGVVLDDLILYFNTIIHLENKLNIKLNIRKYLITNKLVNLDKKMFKLNI